MRSGHTPEFLLTAGVAVDGAGTYDTADSAEYRFDPGHTVTMLAGALEALQAVAAPGPGDPRRPQPLRLAEVLEDARDFTDSHADAPLDPAYAHMSRPALLVVLEEGLLRIGEAPEAHLVVSHGDAGLGALCCRQGESVGFGGWERVALADPHRDLAAAAASVASELGPMTVPELFERLGVRVDPVRLDWWLLARQLTTEHDPGTHRAAQHP